MVIRESSHGGFVLVEIFKTIFGSSTPNSIPKEIAKYISLEGDDSTRIKNVVSPILREFSTTIMTLNRILL